MSAPASRQRSISSRHASGFSAAVGWTSAWMRNLTPSRLGPLDLVDEVVVHLDDVHADFVDPTGEFEYLLDTDRDTGDLPALAQGHVHQLNGVRQVHVGADLLVEAVRADRPHAFAEARRRRAGVRHVAGLRLRSSRRRGRDRAPGQPLPQVYRHPVVSLVRWWIRNPQNCFRRSEFARQRSMRDDSRCYDLPE